jgi:hypothetical protein
MNELKLLNPDTLSSHKNLKVVNLENNNWQCGAQFEVLCSMHNKLSPSHTSTLQCKHKNGTDKWTQENRPSLCHPMTTPSPREFLTVMTTELPTVSVSVPLSPETSPHTPRAIETAAVMTTELPTVSVSVPLSPETSPHTPRAVETAVTTIIKLEDLPGSTTGDRPSNSLWNYETLLLFVIMAIILGVAVFVSLIAVHYVTNRCKVHRPQHHTTENNHLASGLDSNVPFLNPQQGVNLTNQTLGSVIRSSENVSQSVNHEYEEIR